MKVFLLFLTLFVSFVAKAQHCPYDGAYMIVVHLVDKDGNPRATPEGLLLKEKVNTKADSCSYAAGQLAIPFAKAVDSLLLKHHRSWKKDAQTRSMGAEFMQQGYYVVVLNMSQKTCMIKHAPDFMYLPRTFDIEVNGRSTPVTEDSIYSLCTSAGEWKRIRPITVLTE